MAGTSPPGMKPPGKSPRKEKAKAKAKATEVLIARARRSQRQKAKAKAARGSRQNHRVRRQGRPLTAVGSLKPSARRAQMSICGWPRNHLRRSDVTTGTSMFMPTTTGLRSSRAHAVAVGQRDTARSKEQKADAFREA